MTNPPKVKISSIADESIEAPTSIFNSLGTRDEDVTKVILKQLMNILPGEATKDATVINAAVAMIHDLKPTDSYEQMLVVQMLSCYIMSMDFSRRGMLQEQYLDAMDKHINRAAKLMRAFHMHSDALWKYRGKYQQTIKVQHISVKDNAQAVIGDIGGGLNEKVERTTP